jgi:hypothetical protein
MGYVHMENFEVICQEQKWVINKRKNLKLFVKSSNTRLDV